MQPFKKTSEINDGCGHTIEYSNGEQTIIIDIDNPNWEINCETNFFKIHFQKVGTEQSSSLTEGFGMQFLTFDNLDSLLTDANLVKEIVKHIQQNIIPTIKTGD